MFIIGIDPHKGSHTAVAIDGDERRVGELFVCADRRQRERLLCWAAEFEPRIWAVEGATGHGALLSQRFRRRGPDRSTHRRFHLGNHDPGCRRHRTVVCIRELERGADPSSSCC